MHSSKHNKNNNLSFFDSIDFDSMGLSQDGNMSMSKEKMRASLEEVAQRILRSSSEKSMGRKDPVDLEISRVLESFRNSDRLDKEIPFHKVKDCDQEHNEIMQEYKEALDIELATFLPIVKLSSGKYLIGTKQKQL